MSNKYLGYELIKVLSNREVPNNTKFGVYFVDSDKLLTQVVYSDGMLHWEEGGTFNTSYLLDLSYYYKILDDSKVLNIQKIEEIELHKVEDKDSLRVVDVDM